jgi:ADP-heptose:LPS heptosyltransferase
MKFENRNLFRLTRFFILILPWLLKFFAKFRRPQKRLLIIKTDAIGDFVIFRNFIELTKKSETFKDHKVDLLGNILWQDLALFYDSGFTDNFYFANAEALYDAPMKFLKLGWRLFANNYETVLQPTFARTFIGDGLAGFTAAKNIIGWEGNTERIAAKYKSKTDEFYTLRLKSPQRIYLEFERFRYFFERILQQPLTIQQPHLPIKKGAPEGVMIFPGAGVFKRGWETEKFLDLIKLILSHTKHTIYLLGGVNETKAGIYLVENLPANRIENLTGKTSLIQLIELIGNAKLVVTNETSAVHIAGAVKTPSICVLGGGHFGRFVPYDPKVSTSINSVFQKMECYHCNWNCIYQTGPAEPFPCIAAISLENVWAHVKQYL